MATEKGWTDSTGKLSRVSSAAIEQYDQVKVTGNKLVAPAGSGDKAVGVALSAASATGLDVDVLLYNHGGTVPAIIASSTTAGAKVYAAASGLVKPTTTSANVPIGICANGATTTLSQIEVIPMGQIAST